MAIRNVEVVCCLDYKGQKALEAATGKTLHYPGATVSGRSIDGDVKMSRPNNNDGNSIPEFDNLFFVKDEISHEGRVVDVFVERGVRIMSDVWADLRFAVVFEPEGPDGYRSEQYLEAASGSSLCTANPIRLFRTIGLGEVDGSSMFARRHSVIAAVDAPQDVLDIYEGAKLGKKFADAERKYNRQQECIQLERRCVEIDRFVRVTRGRKVPQGTEGKVFWRGDSAWGIKVGIATPQEDGTFRMVEKKGRYGDKTFKSYADVVWTYEKNVQVIDGLGGRLL